MDNQVLKKRLNTYKIGKKGQLRNVSDDVVIDVLRTWENWTGTTADLYRELGLSKMQMATMIQKAKRLIKKGVILEPEFKEVKLEGATEGSVSCEGSMVLRWDKKHIIEFAEVSCLVDFLKKVS